MSNEFAKGLTLLYLHAVVEGCGAVNAISKIWGRCLGLQGKHVEGIWSVSDLS